MGLIYPITPLIKAVSENKLEAVKTLIDCGANTSAALHEAYYWSKHDKNGEMLSYLIDVGCDEEEIIDGMLPYEMANYW